MAEPSFQVFECQNPECRFRFSSDLTITKMVACPQCGDSLQPSGEKYSNEKVSHTAESFPVHQLELLLDNLRSALNVGSIFRTADGAGVSHIYCCGTTPTPDHPKIIKTGLGAEGFVSWSYHRNSLKVIDNLKEKRLVYSLETSESSISLFAEKGILPQDKPILLIVGNEISGIDPELMKRSQSVLSLPMTGSKTSLNVAVAAGIAIYALRFRKQY